MGQSSSVGVSGDGDRMRDQTPIRHHHRSLRSPFSRRKKHRTPLSAAFTAPSTISCDVLNINTATVEQLMTLPTISRQIAQSIVDHRIAIGGRFQKIDDLALVSGIGAEKLTLIRPEITVKRKGGSSTSSRTASLDSVLSEPQIYREIRQMLNINKATIFQLQQIHGMNQEIAAKVIDYRNRKGPYKSLDDLCKVKGLSHARLGAIRTYLSVNDDDLIYGGSLHNQLTPRCNLRQQQTQQQQLPLPSSSSTFTTSTTTPVRNGFGHRKSLSVPIKMGTADTGGGVNTSAAATTVDMLNGCNKTDYANEFSSVPVNDIFDLLGAYSHRPIVEDDSRLNRNCERTIRIGSWNLSEMCADKSSNLGVREVICRTILENKLTIICLQEIVEPEAVHNICDELNNPTLKRVIEWRENSRSWKYVTNKSCSATNPSLNGLGFLFNADFVRFRRDGSVEVALDECASANVNCPPAAYLAQFDLGDWTCYILNMYLRYFDMANTDCVLQCVERVLGRSKNAIKLSDVFLVVGDFSGITGQTAYNNLSNGRKWQNRPKNNNNELNGKTKVGNSTSTSNSNSNNNSNDTNNTAQSTVDLQNLGFFSIIDESTGNGGSLLAATTPSNTGISSTLKHRHSACNILCREHLPAQRSAFREAIYKTSSPLSVYSADATKVPLGGDRLTGAHGVVRQGLNHMAIPFGWSWGGPASEHCPVWIEVRANSMNRKALSRRSLTEHTTAKAHTNMAFKRSNLSLNTIDSVLQQQKQKQQQQQQQQLLKTENLSSTPCRIINTNNNCGVKLVNGIDLNSSSDSVFVTTAIFDK